MRKMLFTLSCIIFISPLCAQDTPSSVPRPPLPPPPTIAHIEIQRPLVEELKTPEEDEAYFGDAEGRFEREQVVIVKQTRLSVEESSDDLLIIYFLTVYSSDGECYGLCKQTEPPLEEGPGTWQIIIPIEPEVTPATFRGGFLFIPKTTHFWVVFWVEVLHHPRPKLFTFSVSIISSM